MAVQLNTGGLTRWTGASIPGPGAILCENREAAKHLGVRGKAGVGGLGDKKGQHFGVLRIYQELSQCFVHKNSSSPHSSPLKEMTFAPSQFTDRDTEAQTTTQLVSGRARWEVCSLVPESLLLHDLYYTIKIWAGRGRLCVTVNRKGQDRVPFTPCRRRLGRRIRIGGWSRQTRAE